MTTQLSQFVISVKENGRVNLPQKLCQQLGLHQGDDLIFRLRDDGSAEVVTRALLARRSRGLFAHLKTAESETDAFLAERRQDSGE